MYVRVRVCLFFEEEEVNIVSGSSSRSDELFHNNDCFVIHRAGGRVINAEAVRRY